MAFLVRELLQKSPSTRTIITALRNPQAPPNSTLYASLGYLQPHLSQPKNRRHHRTHLIPVSANSNTGDKVDPSQPPQIYAPFSFGFFLNPMSSSGSLLSVPEDAVLGESATIWADSVKKKRKRKMNKHKLKKLRKRLRRKS